MNFPRHVFRPVPKFLSALCLLGLIAGLNAASAAGAPNSSSHRDGKVHRGEVGFVSGSPQVSFPFYDDRRATIAMDVAIQNGSKEATRVFVEIVVKDAEGTVVTGAEAGIEITAGEQGSTEQWMNLKRPRYWTPESPYLYTVHTVVLLGSDIVDSSELSFGVGSAAPVVE